MKRKVICLLLCALLCVSILPAAASADKEYDIAVTGGKENIDYQWNEDGTELTVTGSGVALSGGSGVVDVTVAETAGMITAKDLYVKSFTVKGGSIYAVGSEYAVYAAEGITLSEGETAKGSKNKDKDPSKLEEISSVSDTFYVPDGKKTSVPAKTVYITTAYPVWVGGVQFTSENAMTGIPCGKGTARLDMSSVPSVLFLENAEISTLPDEKTGAPGAMIYIGLARKDSELPDVYFDLIGSSKLILDGKGKNVKSELAAGIFAEGSVEIGGTGSLDVDFTYKGEADFFGIRGDKLTFTGGSVSVQLTCDDPEAVSGSCVFAEDKIILNGGHLTVTADKAAWKLSGVPEIGKDKTYSVTVWENSGSTEEKWDEKTDLCENYVEVKFASTSTEAYKLLKGADSEWKHGSEESLIFASDAPYDKFVCVELDGNWLDEVNYTAEEGSTVVTLEKNFLETLKTEKHTLVIVSRDGAVAADFTVMPECEHKNTEVRDAKAAGCTEDGYTGDTWCKDCGVLIANGEVEKATGHVHTEIRNVKSASCTEDGCKGDTYCVDCEQLVIKGDTIKATGHLHTEVRDTKTATCTEEGYTGDTYCKDCGEKIASGEKILRTVHIPSDWYVDKAAEVGVEGSKHRECTTCHLILQTEKIPALKEKCQHKNTETRFAKAASCTSEGYTGDKYCRDCDAKLASGQKIEKYAHIPSGWIVDTEAKEGIEGTRHKECTTCHAVLETEKIPALVKACEHKSTEVRNAKASTCTNTGHTGDTYCKDCGKLISKGTETAKLEHRDYNKDSLCDMCGEDLSIPKTGAGGAIILWSLLAAASAAALCFLGPTAIKKIKEIKHR